MIVVCFPYLSPVPVSVVVLSHPHHAVEQLRAPVRVPPQPVLRHGGQAGHLLAIAAAASVQVLLVPGRRRGGGGGDL